MKINKRNKSFHVQLDGSPRDDFWLEKYLNWENETFDVFDSYVKPNTTVIDIGSWFGPSVLYLSSLGAKVIAVEADRESVEVLKNNINLNKFQVKIIHKAIYKYNTGVYFGENAFRNDNMNVNLKANTSQIVSENCTVIKYQTESITFDELLQYVDTEISLIKVDIEGGEEHILRDVLNFCSKYNVPAYITFNLSWWSEEGRTNFHEFKDLFSLFNKDVQQVINSPVISLVFSKSS